MQKNKKSKSNKVRIIILEGESDHIFFSDFKKKFDKREFDISKLEKEGLNYSKINRLVARDFDVFGYKEVWLVMDLKTQKPGFERNFSKREELIEAYRQRIKYKEPGKVDYIVMVQDLECWLLLYYQGYSNTETIKDAEIKLKTEMKIKGTLSKPLIVKRLIQKTDFWDKLKDNKKRNKSFALFLDKVDAAPL